MNAPARSNQGVRGISSEVPHLSHSRVNKYLHCPEQYRLYYVENLRSRIPDAGLVFGQIIHQALAVLFRVGGDPAKFFRKAWQEVQAVELTYGDRESWERLNVVGETLLVKFVREEFPKLKNLSASERAFTLTVTTLGVPFVGVIDLVADLDGKSTVVDFKTAASAYQDHEVVLNDQLTAYQLAEPDAEQRALCVFLKTKEPRIDWYVSDRKPEQVMEYLAQVEYVAHEIAAGRFYKRPGKWCSYCDYLPVCLGDNKKAEKTLVRITSTNRP